MKLAFSILDWQASAPGLGNIDDWLRWATRPAAIHADRPLEKCRQLPMMMARRLNSGSRLAVDCGLALLRRQAADAIVFTSRHGELERNLRILQALSRNENISPTDFAMSVHNAAVGSLTIAAAAPLVSTSLAAGIDSFQQGLVEVSALQAAGYKNVLLVDFDGAIPEFYHRHIPARMPRYPYAVAVLLGCGEEISCRSTPVAEREEPELPQSLRFLHAFLARQPAFHIRGERLNWQWDRCDV
ncbi:MULTISPECIES: beta-ketoacyl synthase chain length factor [unclassified Brenneria]|uniref:beta-ketoacyl synthase chain length factor n=1 Tax=unclassified Brenneria TaxID=2634434 RepID=UPI00155774B8|nr:MULTISPECIES: beta-ketoacyl synthase chain length factor [unclassified Brenneria]MBJ7222271.1 beta-ketoacyl synthase chain length factor [Brenneria sp. L3-3C-1]MEE3643514.1 beta-ketoacyl synthase chain length factor [Brenneria sp. L3_3C_1]MEE3651698.1 beta-ketoacyl synthase chain length factor [Brenneria sp. HEZEL_4_2_4]NPD01654.1 beta-ketoacyl synthase chain length factor [Brenneria sp. hezel4-2-4]